MKVSYIFYFLPFFVSVNQVYLLLTADRQGKFPAIAENKDGFGNNLLTNIATFKSILMSPIYTGLLLKSYAHKIHTNHKHLL